MTQPSKEPGQLAFETFKNLDRRVIISWPNLLQSDRDEWAAVESAIRADERRIVQEECCKVVCIECRNNVPIVSTPELDYGHWFQYVDGDREQELVDCEAWEIRKQMESLCQH